VTFGNLWHGEDSPCLWWLHHDRACLLTSKLIWRVYWIFIGSTVAMQHSAIVIKWSVTPVYCDKTTKARITRFSLFYRPTLLFRDGSNFDDKIQIWVDPLEIIFVAVCTRKLSTWWNWYYVVVFCGTIIITSFIVGPVNARFASLVGLACFSHIVTTTCHLQLTCTGATEPWKVGAESSFISCCC